MSALNIVLTTVIVEVVAILFYLTVVRHWYCTWGATSEEFHRKMPEDESTPVPSVYMTHAIDINAAPEDVWPWLLQMGQGRGGFYSYDRLERLFGFGIHNVYDLRPEFQNLKEGDHVKLHKNGMGVTVKTLEENYKMVLWEDSRDLRPDRKYFVPIPKSMYIAGFWSFTLDRKPDGTTRFVERWSIEWPPRNLLLNILLVLASEVPSFIMEHRMLHVIKMCAEGNPPVK